MTINRQNYSPKDLRNIEILVNAGYGWAKFANNVKIQGWISEKQSETLTSMVNKLTENRIALAKMYNPSAPVRKQSNISINDVPAMGYKKDYYDEEASSWHGETYYQGQRIDTQWHDNGNTTYHWGGPCAPTTYDKNGEEC